MRVNEDYINYYIIGKKIGEGFGIVYEATKKDTKEKRAIKIIDKELIKNPFRIKDLKEPSDNEIKPYIDCFYKEIENMKKCGGEDNINIVKFYEYFDTKDEFAIVMELCDENMLTFISNKENKLTIEKIKEILKQLNKALKIMTKNKIIYRDLKLENILIKYKENNQYIIKLKLGDGSNLITDLRKQLSSTKNKFYCNSFNAPEILLKSNFNEECDLWSLGVIIYVLCFKSYPYEGVTEDAILSNIKKDGQKNLKSTGNSKLDDLIRRLLIIDPKKRLTWEGYFHHLFITNSIRDIYEIGKKLGEGGFGIIYEATNKETGELRALKIFDKNSIRNSKMSEIFRLLNYEEMKIYIDKFYKELIHMKIIEGENKNNKNAVKVYEYYDNDIEFAIVMELCDGNLLNILAKREKPFSPEEIKELFIQLNNSFKIMVNNNIVHRALILDNILIKYIDEKKYIAKLKLTEDSINIKELSNPYKNIISFGNFKNTTIAPEILKEEKYNEKCDLWSLGVLIYILSFKESLYKGNNIKEILKDINNFNIPKRTDNEDLNDLIQKLLTIDQQKRISWNKYFDHPFFKINPNPIKNDFLIKKEDYKNYYILEERIGGGGFGIVHKVIEKKTKEKRALKIIDKEQIKRDYMSRYLREISKEEMEKNINDLYNEIKNMKIAEDKDNKNTVKYYECFDTENEFAIVMELCDENLATYFANRNETFLILKK